MAALNGFSPQLVSHLNRGVPFLGFISYSAGRPGQHGNPKNPTPGGYGLRSRLRVVLPTWLYHGLPLFCGALVGVLQALCPVDA